MRRFLSLFVTRREAEHAALIIDSITLKEWLGAFAWAVCLTMIAPLVIILIDVREAWLP